MTYASEVMADAPINYWHMDSLVGTDSGSANKTATLNGITSTIGKVENAWNFDGNDYATASLTAIGSVYTIEAWVNQSANAQGTNRIIEWLSPLVTFYIAGSYPSSGAQQGKPGIHINGAELYATQRVDDGEWHHVVFVINGTAASIYIDGALDNTGTVANISLTAKSVTIGSSGPVVTLDYMIGKMDELAIYNKVLTGTRIAAHYDSISLPPPEQPTAIIFRGWSVPL